MRILDENGAQITNPDLELGHLVEEQLLLEHHPKVEAVPEQWHYETVAEYPNGGKDIAKVVDVPGVEEKEAWVEYETILRYVPYTEEELAQIEAEKRKPTMEARVDALEATSDDIILMMAALIGGD